jgi:hypothetical protein
MLYTNEVMKLTGTEVPAISWGAKRGAEPSDKAIKNGTVKMESHPEFSPMLQRVKEKGFEIKQAAKTPSVVIRRVAPTEGEPYVEKQLLVC